jgi:tRNA pseudouridine55 synthase
VDGIAIVDKPKGLTSHDVVYKLRKQLKTSKIGHTGTLDPMATGVLVICIGKATKLVKYLTFSDKEYLAEITFGYLTDTDDITGEILESVDIDDIDGSSLDSALKSFLGNSFQIPPVASAIKVNGKRAYEYVHKNLERPVMEPRNITISAIELLDGIRYEAHKASIRIRVSCSKGTYIRALARDIGKRMNLPATLSALKRTRVGEFTSSMALPLESFQVESVRLFDPIGYLGFQKIMIDETNRSKVMNGVFLPLELFPNHDETIICDPEGLPLAIYMYDEVKNIMRLSVLL